MLKFKLLDLLNQIKMKCKKPFDSIYKYLSEYTAQWKCHVLGKQLDTNTKIRNHFIRC